MQSIGAFSIVFWRFLIASIALAIMTVYSKGRLNFGLIKGNLKELLILSVFLAFHFIFFALAVADTTILNATVLVNTVPIFSVFVSVFIFKLKPSRFALIGLAASFFGVCIIAYAETNVAVFGLHQANYVSTMKGDLEALFAAAVEAIYLTYGKKLRNKMNLLSIILPIYVLASVVVVILRIPVGARVFALPTRVDETLAMVGLGMLPTAIAHTLFFSSLSNLKSFETATMALLEPVGPLFWELAYFEKCQRQYLLSEPPSL